MFKCLAATDRIEKTIVEIYERFDGSKPEVESVKRNLSSAVAAQNIELGKCLTANLQNAKTFFGRFRDTVQICIDFDNSPSPFAAKGKRSSHSEKLAEFNALAANEEVYEWKA